MALVLGLALRARLCAVLALVLVAGAADGEAALVAGDEEVAVHRAPDLVAAYLAHLPAQRAQRLGLLVPPDQHQLVPVVRPGHQPGARLHGLRSPAGTAALAAAKAGRGGATPGGASVRERCSALWQGPGLLLYECERRREV